jgi:hypothetical protein
MISIKIWGNLASTEAGSHPQIMVYLWEIITKWPKISG